MTGEDALRIAASFGVEAHGAAADRLPGSSNENWRVRGPSAAVVVRRYGRLQVSRAAIVFEHAVADHLAARMAEVRAPLRDADGSSLPLVDGAFVAVLPWVDGVTSRRDPVAGAATARALARFHLAGRELHVAGGMRSTRFLGIMPWLIACFQRFAAAGSPIARALPWDDLIVALGASIARIAHADRMPHAIVHGDPHPSNAVLRGDAVAALIDFDFVQETERVYDLGAFVDEFARADDDAPLALERIGPLVAAYDAQASLTAVERELLPDAMLRHAAWLVWSVVSRQGDRAPGDVAPAARYAARVREIARLTKAIA
jgi:Ser/Thr protein kinase RdoA (MazF antagonist)